MYMIPPSKEAMILLKEEYGQNWNDVTNIQDSFYGNTRTNIKDDINLHFNLSQENNEIRREMEEIRKEMKKCME